MALKEDTHEEKDIKTSGQTEGDHHETASSEDNEEVNAEKESKSDEELVKEQKKKIFQLEQDVFTKSLENEGLRKKQFEVEEKLSSIRDYVKKMESEVEAVRSRAKRDQEKEIDLQLSRFLSSFLDVMENLKRSLETSQESTPFQEGVQMISQQMEDCLKTAGVQRMKSAGAEFDPHQHEALSVQPVQDDEQDGKVMQVITEGYKFKDQTLKPAQVIVGKK